MRPGDERSEQHMSRFTEAEIAYLTSQRMGRLATINDAGEPQIAPVGVHYNAATDTIDIGGHNFGRSKKYHNVRAHPMVAFVVDDVPPPWQPRGIEIRGRAEALATGGKDIMASFDDAIIRIHPTRIIAWGLESDGRRNTRNVERA
jgi:pyridoxamine 5'-phosphate oxidase family protein